MPSVDVLNGISGLKSHTPVKTATQDRQLWKCKPILRACESVSILINLQPFSKNRKLNIWNMNWRIKNVWIHVYFQKFYPVLGPTCVCKQFVFMTTKCGFYLLLPYTVGEVATARTETNSEFYIGESKFKFSLFL